MERARAIYKYALDHIPTAQAENLYARFVAFEKQHGDREGIEEVVISKRRCGPGLWGWRRVWCVCCCRLQLKFH